MEVAPHPFHGPAAPSLRPGPAGPPLPLSDLPDRFDFALPGAVAATGGGPPAGTQTAGTWSPFDPAPVQQAATAPVPIRPEPDDPAAAMAHTGRGQTLAIIDTGWSPLYDQTRIVYDHDFAGPGSDPDAGVPTVASHGAQVAETARAIAPGADILHLKVFPDSGGGAGLGDIEEALDFLVDHNAVFDVTAVNLSLGAGNTTQPLTTSLSDEFAALSEAGVLSVVAAGNARGSFPEGGINVLAADPNAIAVSAVRPSGAFAGFSQRDPGLTDIAALGTNVPVSTVDGQTFTVSGTSFAAPAVSGMAALLQQASEHLTGARLDDTVLLDILRASGTPVAGYDGDGPPGYRIAEAEPALDHLLAALAEEADTLLS